MLGFILLLGALNRLQGRRYANGKLGRTRIRNPTYPKKIYLIYLCKRYPSLFILFARRFLPKQLHFLFQNYLDWFEMRDMGYDKITDVIYLSGCFMLFRKKYLDEIGYFDENIFMYFEDADITIRMSEKYRSVFYPHVQVFHHWAQGSYSSWKLALINIQSALYFFRKHGWKII